MTNKCHQAWQDKNNNKDALNFRVYGMSVKWVKEEEVWRFITTEHFCLNGDEMNERNSERLCRLTVTMEFSKRRPVWKLFYTIKFSYVYNTVIFQKKDQIKLDIWTG